MMQRCEYYYPDGMQITRAPSRSITEGGRAAGVELIDTPRWGLWYMNITGQQRAAGYDRLKNTSLSHATETPTQLDLEDRVIMQPLTLGMVLKSLY